MADSTYFEFDQYGSTENADTLYEISNDVNNRRSNVQIGLYSLHRWQMLVFVAMDHADCQWIYVHVDMLMRMTRTMRMTMGAGM